jgi:hypothetical protein
MGKFDWRNIPADDAPSQVRGRHGVKVGGHGPSS